MLQGMTVLHILARHECDVELLIKILDAVEADASIQDIKVRRWAVHIFA